MRERKDKNLPVQYVIVACAANYFIISQFCTHMNRQITTILHNSLHSAANSSLRFPIHNHTLNSSIYYHFVTLSVMYIQHHHVGLVKLTELHNLNENSPQRILDWL